MADRLNLYTSVVKTNVLKIILKRSFKYVTYLYENNISNIVDLFYLFKNFIKYIEGVDIYEI